MKLIDKRKTGKIKLYYAATQIQLRDLDENQIPGRKKTVLISKEKVVCFYDGVNEEIQISFNFRGTGINLIINNQLENREGWWGCSFESIKLKKLSTSEFVISGEFKFNDSNEHKWFLIGKFYIPNLPIEKYIFYEDELNYEDF